MSTGNIISFDVEPNFGMKIIPWSVWRIGQGGRERLFPWRPGGTEGAADFSARTRCPQDPGGTFIRPGRGPVLLPGALCQRASGGGVSNDTAADVGNADRNHDLWRLSTPTGGRVYGGFALLPRSLAGERRQADLLWSAGCAALVIFTNHFTALIMIACLAVYVPFCGWRRRDQLKPFAKQVAVWGGVASALSILALPLVSQVPQPRRRARNDQRVW